MDVQLNAWRAVFPGGADGPEPPAPGRNGRWVKLGTASVDSSQIIIVDPAYVDKEASASTYLPRGDDPYGPYNSLGRDKTRGLGVQLLAGFGDGGYAIWGWIADYGDPEDPEDVDERVGLVTITLIDPADLAEWHRDPDGLTVAQATLTDTELFTVTGPGEWLRRFQAGETVTRVQAAEDSSEWIEVSMTHDELNRLYGMLA